MLELETGIKWLEDQQNLTPSFAKQEALAVLLSARDILEEVETLIQKRRLKEENFKEETLLNVVTKE